jgi:hypothetical protein
MFLDGCPSRRCSVWVELEDLTLLLLEVSFLVALLRVQVNICASFVRHFELNALC